MAKALLVIDLQNDYFPAGNFPLWNAEGTLDTVERLIQRAQAHAIPVILVQHIAISSGSPAAFFNAGTNGAALHPRIKSAAPEAPVIVKSFADAFYQTELDGTLSGLNVTELIICGMMTQNCVTHTAISKSADKYDVIVISDACTTVNEILHNIALNALSTRVKLESADRLML